MLTPQAQDVAGQVERTHGRGKRIPQQFCQLGANLTRIGVYGIFPDKN
jgi:hypothetical protein